MSAETNKAIVRRYYEEVHNQGKRELLKEIAAEDYVEHNPFPGQGQGLDGFRQRVEALQGAFTMNFTIEDMIAEGDKVVVRWTNHNLHQGPFLGVPATGKSVTVSGIDIHRLQNGKLAEHWDVVDMLGLLQQLGVVSMPG
ncbi:MAG TPA: ester cyclase [Anaerolineales bacterium]